jgi:hypothetical protein
MAAGNENGLCGEGGMRMVEHGMAAYPGSLPLTALISSRDALDHEHDTLLMLRIFTHKPSYPFAKGSRILIHL